MDANGYQQWEKTFGTKGEAWGVLQTSDSGYIIAERIPDIRLIKVDTTGNEQWNWTFGGPNTDIGSSIQKTSDDGYILAGYTQSYGAGDRDGWVIRIRESSATASETKIPDINKSTERSTPGFEILGAMISVSILFLLMRKRT